MSAAVTVTAVTSFIGLLLNSLMLVLVLSRGRRTYHYLFEIGRASCRERVYLRV